MATKPGPMGKPREKGNSIGDTTRGSAGSDTGTGGRRDFRIIGDRGDRGTGNSGSGGSGNGPATAGEAVAPDSGEPAVIRLDDDYQEWEKAPRPEKPEAPKRSAKVTLTDRKSAAKAVAQEVCDAANTGAFFVTKGAMVMIDGEPKSAMMTDEEYSKITVALANVLTPYDWITKVKTGSDVGALLIASAGWFVRVYMIYAVTHQKPEQPPQKRWGVPWGRKPAPSQNEGNAENPNGRPPDIDMSTVGFSGIGPVAPSE